jgi:hypothetical protein
VLNHRFRSANCCFEFQKRRQLFIRVHNETLAVVAMRVRDLDCSAEIHGRRSPNSNRLSLDFRR